MIIRAVSDDEGDEDQQRHFVPDSVFDSGPPSAYARDSARGSSLHSAKLVWIGATLALVVLLLVDLAAIMSHFQHQLADPSTIDPTISAARDPFALLPALLDAWTSKNSDSGGASVFGSVFAASPATALNNLLGFLGVAAWIFSRETSAQVARSRVAAVGNNTWTAAFPWVLIVCVFCFGHVVSCVYVLLALFESNGDRSKFFLGKTSAGRTHPHV